MYYVTLERPLTGLGELDAAVQFVQWARCNGVQIPDTLLGGVPGKVVRQHLPWLDLPDGWVVDARVDDYTDGYHLTVKVLLSPQPAAPPP